MPRPDPHRPREGQEALFAPPTTSDDMLVNRGRHANAMGAALARARADGLLSEVDSGLATVLLSGAWALDSFEAQNKPYGPSKMIQPMLEALQAAGMTPDARGTQTDDHIQELLERMNAAAMEDDRHVSDPA